MVEAELVFGACILILGAQGQTFVDRFGEEERDGVQAKRHPE